MKIDFYSVYSHMPVTIQNLLVSTKGVILYWERYRGRYREYVDELMRSQWFSASQFREMQTIKLRNLLTEALFNVPYYREKFAKIRGKIEKFTLDDLRELPFVDKIQLRRNTHDFLNQSKMKYALEKGHTSGTSGTPLEFPIDIDSLRFSMALDERHYRWGGVTTFQRSVRFTNKVILGKRPSPPFWRYNAVRNQWLFSVYHLKEDTLSEYFKALKRIAPVYIEGAPSAMFAVARYVHKCGLVGEVRPAAVFTTGETLTDFYRKEIESAFGSRVFNYYASSEGAPVICECASGNLHINPESGIIEFIKQDGTPAQRGELAEMVVTSLRQRAMPLIRYRIGDMAILSDRQSCPCRREMPIVERIEGRESDLLYLPDGKVIGSATLSTLLYGLPSRIAFSQIQQITLRELIFRYVPIGKPLERNEEQVLINEFKRRLGTEVNVKLEICTEIPKSVSGKARLIIGLNERT